jgi:hypothetical protein
MQTACGFIGFRIATVMQRQAAMSKILIYASKTGVAGRRNGRRTGLKNPLLAISGRQASLLAERTKPLILLMFYHYYANSPCIPKSRRFLMKLAQYLAQTGSTDRTSPVRLNVLVFLGSASLNCGGGDVDTSFETLCREHGGLT